MRAFALATVVLFAARAFAASDEYTRFVTAAVRLFENLEYERALEQLANAKKYARTPDEQTEVALYEGVLLLELGRSAEAKAALQTALFLSPDAKVPVRVSPKVLQQLEAVRREVKKELAPILAKKTADDRAKAEAAERERKQRIAAEEAAKRKALEQKRRDANADPVLVPDPAIVEPPPAELVAQPEVKKGRGIPIIPLAFLGATGGTLIVASIFGRQSQSIVQLARDMPFQDDSNQRLLEAQGKATVANVFFGVTCALLIATVVSGIFWASSGDPAQ